VGLVATGALAVGALLATPEVPPLLVAYGRYMITWVGQVDVKYFGEGMNSSVAVTTLASNGATQFHVSGKVEASTLPQDMRLQRMLADLPALVHPDPRSVLVVGFGAGVTAGSFVPYPNIQRLTICEIEPLIPEVVSRYFTRENNDVLHDRRTRVVYDDARSYILTTHDKFDIITSDPIHPWVKGAASLYTREYFEAVKAHLNPGGVVTQWVPLYESTPEAVKSEIATFFSVFPHGTIWANNVNGGGYDLVLLGQDQPTRNDVAALAARFGDPRYVLVAQSLGEVGFDSPVALFSTYAGSGADLQPWLADASINRDRNLRLQYLAAAGLNSYRSEAIYNQIASYRRFPETLFVADESWLARLRATITGASP
jgi:spermidine synthase